MYNTLTEKQKEIVDCTYSKIIVKACPGSGKTYSVTARLEKLLNKKEYRHEGIVVLSFTNIACEEIKGYLKENCNISNLDYPHFIGTFDSFINNYIFLPYGHLWMNCDHRPEIVGTEYNKWFDYDSSITRWNNQKKKNEINDPNYYFDKVSFGLNDEPFPLAHEMEFRFSWKKYKNQDGNYRKELNEIIDRKYFHFSQGKANQSDAIYIAYRLLKEYPQITKNLSRRFPVIIVDEAQDTTELQMAILDELISSNVNEVMLIGDPDQAIFEWNTADSSLFMGKYKNQKWHHIVLNENRRSSQNICDLLNNFYDGDMNSISEFRNNKDMPKIIGHNEDQETILNIKKKFLAECKSKDIEDNSIAIVYRGSSFGEQFFEKPQTSISVENQPWEKGYYFVRDIVHGKFLIDEGDYKEGYKLVEKGFLKLQNPEIKYVTNQFIKKRINDTGFRKFRNEVFEFLQNLPSTKDNTLLNWHKQFNQFYDYKIKIKSAQSRVSINQFFIKPENITHNECHIDTVHSVKGSTYDAILLYLKKRSANSDYKTILEKNYTAKTSEESMKKDEEEIRIVYVACSRPKRLIWLAVYNGTHFNVWENKLKI
ncbi:MAG: UvrD-helicase domain-containing protein [Prolixibacteraceae bacterium]